MPSLRSLGGAVTVVDYPVAHSHTIAAGINDAHVVAGSYYGDDNVVRGYLRIP